MPEYCVTSKEIWYSYISVEAANIDEAVDLVRSGIGDTHDSDYSDTLGYVSIHNEDTGEDTDLVTQAMDTDDPNNIFAKSKKQKEVDKAIRILNGKHLTHINVEDALNVLRSIKNI